MTNVDQMHKMKASDSLSEDQIRQMLFDLESAYNKFHKSLSSWEIWIVHIALDLS